MISERERVDNSLPHNFFSLKFSLNVRASVDCASSIREVRNMETSRIGKRVVKL